MGHKNDGYCNRNRGTEYIKSPEMLTIAHAERKDGDAFDRRKRVRVFAWLGGQRDIYQESREEVMGERMEGSGHFNIPSTYMLLWNLGVGEYARPWRMRLP